MSNVVRLVVENDRKPVRACATCRYFHPGSIPSMSACMALGGAYPDIERLNGDACGSEGRMWEAAPPQPPTLWQRMARAILTLLPK